MAICKEIKRERPGIRCNGTNKILLQTIEKYRPGLIKEQEISEENGETVEIILRGVSNELKEKLRVAVGSSSTDTQELSHALSDLDVDLQKLKDVVDAHKDLLGLWSALFLHVRPDIYKIISRTKVKDASALYTTLVPDFEALVGTPHSSIDYEYELWFWLYYDLVEILQDEELAQVLDFVITSPIPPEFDNLVSISGFPFLTLFLASSLPSLADSLVRADYKDYAFLPDRDRGKDAAVAAEHDSVMILSYILEDQKESLNVNLFARIAASHDSIRVMQYLFQEHRAEIQSVNALLRLAAGSNSTRVLHYLLDELELYPTGGYMEKIRDAALRAGALDAIRLLISHKKQKTSAAIKVWLTEGAKYNTDVFRAVISAIGKRPRLSVDAALVVASLNMRPENVDVLLQEKPFNLTKEAGNKALQALRDEIEEGYAYPAEKERHILRSLLTIDTLEYTIEEWAKNRIKSLPA